MTKTRLKTLLTLLKGLLGAVALTLLGMAGIAALAVFARVSDGMITALNQLLKAAAIILGVSLAMDRGGERGFLTGMALAMSYVALGYWMVVALGGSAFSAADMLGEVLLGAAVGGVAGAVRSNLPPRRRRRAA